jgi:large subunit ribosomal protein L10
VNREEKQREIDSLRKEFEGVKNAYLVAFAGLDVGQVTDLRRKARAASARYRVVKNRLAIRAIEGTALAGQTELFGGPTAVAYTGDDPVALAKVLAEFQKNTSLQVKGLVIEGKPMPAASLDQITSLPTRPELITQFAGMLRSPVQKFVLLLTAPIRDLATVVKQVGEKKSS